MRYGSLCLYLWVVVSSLNLPAFEVSTLVKTPYGDMALGEVRMGDPVLCRGETLWLAIRPVLDSAKHQFEHMLVLCLEEGSRLIVAPHVLFYDHVRGVWKPASELRLGDMLRTYAVRPIAIVAIEPCATPLDGIEVSVAEYHNLFVSRAGVLAHNAAALAQAAGAIASAVGKEVVRAAAAIAGACLNGPLPLADAGELGQCTRIGGYTFVCLSDGWKAFDQVTQVDMDRLRVDIEVDLKDREPAYWYAEIDGYTTSWQHAYIPAGTKLYCACAAPDVTGIWLHYYDFSRHVALAENFKELCARRWRSFWRLQEMVHRRPRSIVHVQRTIHKSDASEQDVRNAQAAQEPKITNALPDAQRDEAARPEIVGDGTAKTLEQLLEGAVPGRETMGKSEQWCKPGGLEEALKDFESLNPTDVKAFTTKKGPGKVGILSDGRRVNVRPSSESQCPTVEIQGAHSAHKIKVRYVWPT